jgi:hypothetical protein
MGLPFLCSAFCGSLAAFRGAICKDRTRLEQRARWGGMNKNLGQNQI